MTKKKKPKFLAAQSKVPEEYYHNLKKTPFGGGTIETLPEPKVESEATDANLDDDGVRIPKINNKAKGFDAVSIVKVITEVVVLVGILLGVLWFLFDLKYSIGTLDSKVSAVDLKVGAMESDLKSLSKEFTEKQNSTHLSLEKIFEKFDRLFDKLPRK